MRFFSSNRKFENHQWGVNVVSISDLTRAYAGTSHGNHSLKHGILVSVTCQRGQLISLIMQLINLLDREI